MGKMLRMQRYVNAAVNLISLCIYTHINTCVQCLILDTVKVQCPPFSVVEVDRAGRERSVGIFRGGTQCVCISEIQ